MSSDWDIAVVGAGVAGLTAARVAAEAGQRVIVYDRLSPGGQLVNLCECLTGDILGLLRCDCGAPLEQAFGEIAAEGCGAVVYLRGQEG